MPIETIEVGKAPAGELTVTIRGDPTEIVRVLATGLPREALEQLLLALQAELQDRAAVVEP